MLALGYFVENQSVFIMLLVEGLNSRRVNFTGSLRHSMFINVFVPQVLLRRHILKRDFFKKTLMKVSSLLSFVSMTQNIVFPLGRLHVQSGRWRTSGCYSVLYENERQLQARTND